MAEAGSESSMREIRRRLRELPAERRREVARTIRQGRAVSDPRDASLAAAWAEHLAGKRRAWPWWLIPRRRPTGWKALAWIVHGVWMVGAVAYACVEVGPGVWSAVPGLWRWVIVGFLVYGLISLPMVLWFILRIEWNAPEAARKNREVAERP